MPKPGQKVPELEPFQKAAGQPPMARVWMAGRDHDCGTWGTPEAQAKYAELLASWLQSPDASGPSSVRWLGIEWIGTPWPKRLRLRWPVWVRPAEGCGCVAGLKRWGAG